MAETILHQGVGYGLIVGLGAIFAIIMIVITWSLKRYNNELQTSEMFTTAGRSLKSGLIASSVVSTWTWAATLLQSTSVAYRYGVSGPFWYAAGATVQIILFATLAIELKRRAPNAHTFLEVVKARYGGITHGVFIVFCVMTNMLVTSMLLVGGSAVIENLTGAPTAATVFLFPLGVVVYTLFGGIKATVITDYINAFVIIVIIFIFAFVIYSTNAILGSPGKVWEILQEIAAERPLAGNAGGSYLTMNSKGGGEFFVINIIGNFGTVFLDNGYYNKAISASPVDALPGYVMGGLSWFAIPWLTATTMGLAGLCLERYDVWPTYPARLTEADVSAGLVLPNVAVAIMGKGGAIATLLLAFMAIMSTYSSELISISSIFTYDIYRTYMNTAASGKQLMRLNYISMSAFALIMGGFSCMFYYIGIGMGFIYLLMGCIISSAVLPATLTLLWDGQSWAAATFSPILGFISAIVGWLVTAQVTYGELTIASTGSNIPMLVGNCTALLSPLVFIPILTFVPPFKPQKYDWESMLAISKADDHDIADAAHMDLERMPGEVLTNTVSAQALAEERIKLDRAAKIARYLCVGLTIALLVIWPMPMFGSSYIFSKKFFTGWVVVGITWLFATSGMTIILPLWESRSTISRTSRAMFKDLLGLTGKRAPEVMEGEREGATESGAVTPPEFPEKTTEKV
ncbi:urea active transporter [Plectosphaerella plurivora]|uniref:Urea active transporter n=1 Tax=Plectosphaerella plurivora TaxID=936078 RepID=A0A9P8VIQ2_9PEZI|nr:urea active transporter [Plectosphaerella plurivora]